MGKKLGEKESMNAIQALNSVNSVNSINSMDVLNSIELNASEADESADVSNPLDASDASDASNASNAKDSEVPEVLSDADTPFASTETTTTTASDAPSHRRSRSKALRATRSRRSPKGLQTLKETEPSFSSTPSSTANPPIDSIGTVGTARTARNIRSKGSKGLKLAQSSSQNAATASTLAQPDGASTSAPVSAVVSEIASMFLQKDGEVNNLLEEVLDSQPSSEPSSPQPMGKGAYYSPSQVEALTKEASTSGYDASDSTAPMGFLRTCSTPSLIAAKKMISQGRSSGTRTVATRARGRTRTRGRPRGSRSGVRARRRGKGGVLLSPIGSDEETPAVMVEKAMPSEETVKKTREELLLSLRVLSGTQDMSTPPSVTRMLNDYNSMLTQEMNQLMIINRMEARGVKRGAPGPYPNNLNDEDVMELRQFVNENGGNIKKLQQIVSFLEEIDKLGKKAVDRIFPEGEKGGCASQGIQITKESLRQSIYAVL